MNIPADFIYSDLQTGIGNLFAEVFVEEAERNGKLPTPNISPEREVQIAEFLRKSRRFLHTRL